MGESNLISICMCNHLTMEDLIPSINKVCLLLYFLHLTVRFRLRRVSYLFPGCFVFLFLISQQGPTVFKSQCLMDSIALACVSNNLTSY